MIEVLAERDEMGAAAAVAANVELAEVSLSRIQLSNRLHECHPANLAVEVSHGCLGHSVQGSLLSIEVGVVVRFLAKQGKESESDEKDCAASIDVAYRAVYQLPEGPMPKQIAAAVPAFANLNALYNCWPYLRAEVQRLTGEMSLPPFVLPVLKIKTKQESEPANARPKKETKARKPKQPNPEVIH